MARDPSAAGIGWTRAVFARYVVAYLVIGRDISLVIVYYDAFLTYFQEYVVTVEGLKTARSMGVWAASDRIRFRIGEGPSYEAEAVFTVIDVCPFVRRKLTLSVNCDEVVTVSG